MRSLPALFSAAALAIAIQVQSLSSAFGGMWLFFLFLSCIMMVQRNGIPRHESIIQCCLMAWLFILGLSCLVIAPIAGSAAVMWILVAFPLLALSVHREDLHQHLKYFYITIMIYALGLILQMYLGVKYTNYTYVGRAWPMIDPNNASAVINFALLPSLYLALRKPKWLISVIILLIAMYATHSRGGMAAFAIGGLILLWERYGRRVGIGLSVFALVIMVSVAIWKPELINLDSYHNRLAVWSATIDGMLELGDSWYYSDTRNPVLGYGLGSFHYIYELFRTEYITSGFFAHNDLLQFWVELGNVGVLIFIALIYGTFLATHRGNIVSGAVMAALLFQAMIEFQFYVPAISLLMGLAMAHHLLNLKKECVNVATKGENLCHSRMVQARKPSPVISVEK